MRVQRKCYVYTAFTAHYKYSTIVHAKNIAEARRFGLHDARMVMGTAGRIHRDEVVLHVPELQHSRDKLPGAGGISAKS